MTQQYSWESFDLKSTDLLFHNRLNYSWQHWVIFYSS